MVLCCVVSMDIKSKIHTVTSFVRLNYEHLIDCSSTLILLMTNAGNICIIKLWILMLYFIESSTLFAIHTNTKIRKI